MLLKFGLKKNNLFLIDSKGLVSVNRDDINIYKKEFAVKDILEIDRVVEDSDVLIGVSGENIFTPKMVRIMNSKPIIFALSNPVPEIYPCVAKSIRSDLIIATGRSDFNNQVNNVLCFPYLFRGALDVRAKKINDAMLLSAVNSIRDLAKCKVPVYIKKAYNCNVL